ncbi:hypothetical protein [Listeria booriae]|uniref:hypothetical protein n=1 Tax=Listeria booriae TaxID=1552123 RepID=UPI001624186C|nr:hypothetical protein [Listeria booriae]MBC2069342.1 hypothetical protein [Listeria booriae]
MELEVIEEQLNGLDGGVLEVGYNEEAKAHLLLLHPEKKGDEISIWVDGKLKNKMMDALTLKELDQNDIFVLENLKKLVCMYTGDVIAALAYAKNDSEFNLVWKELENKNLILQKLATWALEQEDTIS